MKENKKNEEEVIEEVTEEKAKKNEKSRKTEEPENPEASKKDIDPVEYKRLKPRSEEEIQQKALDFDTDAENLLEKKFMTRKERRAYKKAERKHMLAGYTKKERRHYYIHYYKWPAFIILVLAIIIGKFSYDLIKGAMPQALCVAILNAETSNHYADYIDETMRDYYSDIKSYYQITVEGDYSISLDTYLDDFLNSTSTQLTDAEELAYKQRVDMYDAIISDEEGILYCATAGLTTSVNAYLDEELYEVVEDDVIIFDGSEDNTYISGETYVEVGDVMAIDISDTEFAKGLGLDYDDVYVAFPGTSAENYENAVRFIKMIYGL